MRIAIVLYGSRGDVVPGLALGQALRRAGYEVSVAVPPNYQSLAHAADVGEVYPVGADSASPWQTPEAKAALSSSNPLTRLQFVLSTFREGYRRFDKDLIDLYVGTHDDPTAGRPDVIVTGALAQERILAIAERNGIRCVTLRLGPASENGVIGATGPSMRTWSPWAKKMSWRVVGWLTWLATGWMENRFRRRVGVRGARGPVAGRLAQHRVLQIQAYEPLLFPGLARQWGATRPIVGFMGLPGAEGVSAELRRWLEAGEPPVFIGFGSMPIPDTAALMDQIRGAATTLGCRVLVSVAGADPSWDVSVNPTASVVSAGAFDHSTVLPLCRAAIHHGGAGTVASSLRAGLPTGIYAVTADQPLWGTAVADAGVGTFRRWKELDAETLVADIRHLSRPDVVAAASSFAAQMAAPDAAATAAVAAIGHPS